MLLTKYLIKFLTLRKDQKDLQIVKKIEKYNLKLCN